jgi:hypothetical protein
LKGKTMSHKAAKAIRKTIRAGGTDPRQTNVNLGKSNFIPGFPGEPGALFKGQRTLKPGCGRALYRNTKRLHRTDAFA